MYKTKENKKGISLIVLVITIIVIIILVAAIILTLTGNNPIAEARKATFLNDVATFRDDLNMYKTNEYAKRMGDYDPSLLNATSSGLTYNGTSISGQDNIYDVIPSLEGKTKYLNEFEISSGEIKYTGANTEKADWAQNIAGIIADSAKPAIAITTSNILPVKAGTSVIYNISMTSSVAITTTNLSGNIKILNNAGAELTTQPNINIGSVTGTEKEKTATITINTTGMSEGIYKMKILGDGVKTASQGNIESISTATFEIDNTAPNMPTITLNPTTATNGNVTVTITKANVSDTLEYSTNGTTWNSYTTELTVTSNLTVYAREIDAANNVSSQATQIISNIDKTLPQNAIMNLTTTPTKINGTITIADSGSGINVSQSKYIVTTQSTLYSTNDIAWNSAIVMGTASKTISETVSVGFYYIQVLSVDSVGNKLVNSSGKLTTANYVWEYSGSWTGNYSSTFEWNPNYDYRVFFDLSSTYTMSFSAVKRDNTNETIASNININGLWSTPILDGSIYKGGIYYYNQGYGNAGADPKYYIRKPKSNYTDLNNPNNVWEYVGPWTGNYSSTFEWLINYDYRVAFELSSTYTMSFSAVKRDNTNETIASNININGPWITPILNGNIYKGGIYYYNQWYGNAGAEPKYYIRKVKN